MTPPVISTSTFVMVVRMLAMLCNSSPAIAVQLLRQSKSLSDINKQICWRYFILVVTPKYFIQTPKLELHTWEIVACESTAEEVSFE